MIGVFDSGVGGLSVWHELYELMPEQDYVYFSDSKYCPYGNKSLEYILERAEFITEFLIEKGAEVVVVACNTATMATIRDLRSKYDIGFVGIEPAIKLAARTSKTKVVGVLATDNTLKGDLYRDSLGCLCPSITVIERVGEGLVELVENGNIGCEEAEKLLYPCLVNMLDDGIDTLVLGCTHYPFLTDAILKIVGAEINVLNPAVYVAARTKHIMSLMPNLKPSSGENYFYSNGKMEVMKIMVKKILPNINETNFIKLT